MKKHHCAVKRRAVLKGASAVAAIAATGPWIIASEVLASSGVVNILMWPDYLPDAFKKAFARKTGIIINHLRAQSNAEIMKKMRSSKGREIDICSPTNSLSQQWSNLGLLQAFDKRRIKNLHNVNPTMLNVGVEDWNFAARGSHWLPLTWGTEAIAWRTDKYTPGSGIPSYGNLWKRNVKGNVMLRPHSGMLGAGLYLETNGTLEPGAMRRAYSSEKKMTSTWQIVTAFCIRNKDQIKLFWNDADTQKGGFMNKGVVLGQTSDTPALTLRSAGRPIAYQAPGEGALTWINGVALSAAARNIDQAYAFINFSYSPRAAALAIESHGHNSATLGAEKFAQTDYRNNFSASFPGDSLNNLWIWPREPQWYTQRRTKFVQEFRNAQASA